VAESLGPGPNIEKMPTRTTQLAIVRSAARIRHWASSSVKEDSTFGTKKIQCAAQIMIGRRRVSLGIMHWALMTLTVLIGLPGVQIFLDLATTTPTTAIN